MTDNIFDAIATELFGSILAPLGFSCNMSKHCTFYRHIEGGVYHFIMASIGSRGSWYQVFVFPHSPYIDPLFQDRFPDNVGIPTDSYSRLSEADGVNLTQQQFNCKAEGNFRHSFITTVAPLLLNVAVPYLDCFQSVASIIPAIRHPSFLGFALHHVGRSDEAVPILQREKERLQQLDTKNNDVAALLAEVERLLDE